MARKKNETAETGSSGHPEGNGFAPEPISKADAARAVREEGIDSPIEGVAEIQRRFGIEMSRGHFSAEKGRFKGKEAEAKPAVRRGRPPKVAAPQEATAPVTKARTAAQSQPTGADADLLMAMEAIKPLVEQMGADKLKRIVDLLG